MLTDLWVPVGQKVSSFTKANSAPCSRGDGGQSQPPLYGSWGPGQLRNSVQFTPSSVTKMFFHVQKLSTLYFYILVHNFKNKSKEKNEAKASWKHVNAQQQGGRGPRYS